MASTAPGMGSPETWSTPSMSSRMQAMERESMSRRLDGGDPIAEVPASPAPEREIRVTRSVLLPLSELEMRASRSSGPGGQHAQKSETRVEAVFDVEASAALSPVQKRRVIARAGPVLRAVAQDERSQTRNRELAIERLAGRLAWALRVDRRRVPTGPTAASQERRLEEKRRRSTVKRLRNRPRDDP